MSNQMIGWLQCTQCGFGEWVSALDEKCDGNVCDHCGIGPVKISWELRRPSEERSLEAPDDHQALRDRIKNLENIIREIIFSDPDDAWYVAKQMWKEIGQ